MRPSASATGHKHMKQNKEKAAGIKRGRRVARATNDTRRAKLERMFGGKYDVKAAKGRVQEAMK